jgi:phage baseplate assembly protein W
VRCTKNRAEKGGESVAELITGDAMQTVELQPETELRDILQCVKTILVTDQESVPFARNIGVKADALHRRTNTAEVILRRDIYTAIQDQETRVSTSRITFDGSQDAHLTPTVEVEING